MGWTKRQFIERAYWEIGLPPQTLSPERYTFGLDTLDSMVATWLRNPGIHIGYPFPNTPADSSFDTLTEVPDDANEAVYLNLAKRLAPSVGKTPSLTSFAAAKEGFNGLCIAYIPITTIQRPSNLPVGAGNRPISTLQSEFFQPVDPDQTERSNDIEGNH